MTMIKY